MSTEQAEKAQILVADHQALFRHSLAGFLADARPGWSAAQAGGFDEVLEHLADDPHRCVLLDLDLPALGGTDGLRQLGAAYPEATVVILADSDDRDTILQCLSAGARGFIPKSTGPAQFLRALEIIVAGGVYAPSSLAGKPAALALPARPPARPEHDLEPIIAQMTERQREVFCLLAEGCATKTIARRLNLAVGTVKVHLAAIYRALGAHSRLEALAKARNGQVWPAMLAAGRTEALARAG